MRDMTDEAREVKAETDHLEFATRAIRFAVNRTGVMALRLRNPLWNVSRGRGTSILDADWDNLLLLDACRYDEFRRQEPFPDRPIRKRTSVGSKTPEFLERTFTAERLHDTVYVTANPQVLKFESEKRDPTFHAVVSLLDSWDRELQTIPPDAVRNAAVDIANEYPNKRLIVHFIQPHTPFLGETAAKIRARTGKTIGGLNPGRDYTNSDPKRIDTASYQRMLARSEVSGDEIIAAYRETLEIVLKEVQKLVEELTGKTAVTSDHGELLGERYFPTFQQQWGHPRGVRLSELCEVPWVEFPTTERKEVVSENPEEMEPVEDDVIDTRLRALGYA